ncbi:MAG: pilus assembly protein TadE [Cellulomonadaceae bacterium]|nr:pilus assembly protein TadE [Cellulomonadaceae bacterium]
MRRLTPDERGSTTLELAILAPALILLLGLLVFAGRIQVAASAVEHAARSAARDASLARTTDAARTAAASAADRELADSRCVSTSVSTDTAGFATSVGADASVTVSVTCTVSIADLAVPGLPGTRTMTATARSPLDRYRSR